MDLWLKVLDVGWTLEDETLVHPTISLLRLSGAELTARSSAHVNLVTLELVSVVLAEEVSLSQADPRLHCSLLLL